MTTVDSLSERVVHKKPSKKINKWQIVKHQTSPYAAPEQAVAVLQGVLDNGKTITTSKIVKIDFVSNIIETLNTIYILGVMSYDYRLYLENNP